MFHLVNIAELLSGGECGFRVDAFVVLKNQPVFVVKILVCQLKPALNVLPEFGSIACERRNNADINLLLRLRACNKYQKKGRSEYL